MYSLLVTPIQRSSIVLGKVFSLMTISGISAIVYVTALAVAANTIFKTSCREQTSTWIFRRGRSLCWEYCYCLCPSCILPSLH
nr:hypothetical protein [Suipraeoptans intestinalis]